MQPAPPTRPATIAPPGERLYFDVASFKNLLIWHLNLPLSPLEDQYLLERASLLGDVRTELLVLPDFVMRCRTLEEFDAFMHDEVGDHRPARIRFLWAQFKPLQDRLSAEHRRLRAERKAAARVLRAPRPSRPCPSAGP